MDEHITVRVSNKSKPDKVAGAVAKLIRNKHPVTVQAIGSIASYIAVKALILVASFLEPDDITIMHQITYGQIPDLHDQDARCIKFAVVVQYPD